MSVAKDDTTGLSTHAKVERKQSSRVKRNPIETLRNLYEGAKFIGDPFGYVSKRVRKYFNRISTDGLREAFEDFLKDVLKIDTSFLRNKKWNYKDAYNSIAAIISWLPQTHEPIIDLSPVQKLFESFTIDRILETPKKG